MNQNRKEKLMRRTNERLSFVFPSFPLPSRRRPCEEDRLLPCSLASWAQPSLCFSRRRELEALVEPRGSWGGHRQRLQGIERLLCLGADPNPWLLTAVWHGEEEIVVLLLRFGADPNLVGRNEQSALELATQLQQTDRIPHARLLRLLLDAGADPNRKNARGQTPLLLHLQSGTRPKPVVVRELLQGGADPNVRDRKRKTALSAALQLPESEEKRRVVTLLEEAGGSL